MTSIKDKLLIKVADTYSNYCHKITVVGAGKVGTAIAFCLLTKNIASEICMIDSCEDKLKGELCDLQHTSMFTNNPKITGSSDYAYSANSRICIITIGATVKEDQSLRDLAYQGTDLMKEIIPQIMLHSPYTILVILTHPVDVMTFVAWKISGLPKNRVIGTGTVLDTASFRLLLSKRLEVAPTDCQGWILGSHGYSIVPVWSTVSVGGVRLHDINVKIGLEGGEGGEDTYSKLAEKIIQCTRKIVEVKGHTSWGFAASTAAIVSAIMRNTNEIFTISTSAVKVKCIQQEVFISLPCIIGANGVTSVVEVFLSPDEINSLLKIVNALHCTQIHMDV